MPRLGFRSTLVALTLALVATAIGGVAAVSYWQLRRLVHEDARDAAAAAALALAEAVRAAANESARAARVLDDVTARGTAAGALRAEELTAFLDRFAASNGLDACGVVTDGRLVASGDLGLLEMPPATAGGPSVRLRPNGNLAVAAGDGAAAVALELDADWLAAFRAGSAVEARWLAPAETLERFAEPQAAVWREALAGRASARVFAGETGAVAAHPLVGPDGQVIAIFETRRGQGAIAAPLRRFVQRTAVATLAIGLGAALAAILLARRLAAPIHGLAAAAHGFGRDGPAAPFPLAGTAGDVGVLGSAMEDMRRRLVATSSELDRRGNELESILSGIAEGVYAVDRERKIRYLNPQAAALLGVETASAIGSFCGDVLRPARLNGVRPCEDACPILHARARGATRSTERLQLPAGERSVILSSAPPVGGVQVQILREESPLEAARRGRDEVVADFAHELKTPLAAQSASLELLRERLAHDPGEGGAAADRGELAGLVASAEAGTLRLRRLIDNLLESVRIESGQTGIRRVAVALDEVVEEAVEMTAPLLARRRQQLEVALAYPLPGVLGDPPRLAQVLVNLLSNASKFAAEGSVVRVVATVVTAGVELAVEDEGPGFPAGAWEAGPRRFARGVQNEPREEGIGLGLWIARSIVERHGGRLTIARNQGRTRIAFELPRASGEIETPPAVAETAP